MRKIFFVCSILLLVPLAVQKTGAQEKANKQPATVAAPQPAHFYRLDFIVEHLDAAGKVVNSRSYSTIVDADGHNLSSVRTSSRIPIITGPVSPNSQFTYIDTGVDLDIKDVREIGRQLAFDLTASLSDEASSAQATGLDPHPPVIRQNKWQSNVLIPIGKRTAVFTSDSLDSKGSTRLVVNATPIED